ncbi:hypothetical protein MHU86_14854 [Fragilaria crotonensis]|nr:hypothetical protein MHU86_14854 [Fragilaria crotonensis]
MMVPPREMVYQPAPLEQYLVDNALALGFDKAGDTADDMASGFEIWNNEGNPMYNTTQTFRRELKNYYTKIASFRSLPDLRTLFLHGETNRDEVSAGEPNSIPYMDFLKEGFFNESKQLSC